MPKPYDLSLDELTTLAAAVANEPVRHELLNEFGQKHGADALAHMLGEYIALTLQVQEHARGFLEMFGIVDGQLTDREAEDLNVPTIAGALEGAHKAIHPAVPGMCKSCAYRLGSVPSQCLPTIQDAQYAIDNCAQFMCHETLDGDDEPTRMCAGFVHARALQESTNA